MSATSSSDPDFSGRLAAFGRTERVVDAFEAGRLRRAAEDAAEIRLLADAAAAVTPPADASVEQRRRCELDRRALIADLATSTRTSEWTVTRLLTEATDLCARFAAGVDALGRGVISRQHLSVSTMRGTGSSTMPPGQSSSGSRWSERRR